MSGFESLGITGKMAVVGVDKKCDLMVEDEGAYARMFLAESMVEFA